MFAVIDCGTTNTRIYIVDQNREILASGSRKVGVRDTSITGSRDALRQGIAELFFEILREHGIEDEKVEFAVASGMITSEIGLIEIPHLVAPAGVSELAEGILEVSDESVLPIHRPVYFIRGIKNSYPEHARAQDLRDIDFMRGEEVQCIGIIERNKIKEPCSIVALSSHTKVMYIDGSQRVAASNTTISGQFYEALVNSTNIGKSLKEEPGEEPGGYTYEELVDIAVDCVEHAGLGRTLLMPRFLQVLLKTDGRERNIFANAAIAADDLKAFDEMRKKGYLSGHYIFYGHENRCRMYEYLLKKRYGEDLKIEFIYDQEEIGKLTVQGAVAIAFNKIKEREQEGEACFK